MPAAPATWSRAPRVDAQLGDTRFRDIRWFTCIDSTNRYLLGEATHGAVEGVVAVADEQTAGRGRHGRTWTSTPGAALLVSVLLRPDLPPERRHLVTLAAGIAASEAVLAVGAFAAKLKWPNDLVVDDRKLAGILAEADGTGGVVVGMGLNLTAAGFPPELAGIATTCDQRASGAVDRGALLVAWLGALDRRLDALDGVLASAAGASATLGRRVRVELAHRQFSGVATRLTDEGYLVVAAADGTEQVVTAGDVIHLRPEDR